MDGPLAGDHCKSESVEEEQVFPLGTQNRLSGQAVEGEEISMNSTYVTHTIDVKNKYTIEFTLPRKYVAPISHIGAGSYSNVCTAMNSETGERVAIKKIIDAFRFREDAKKAYREVKILRQLHHENVIVAKEVICIPQNLEPDDALYIVSEFMHTDLEQIIAQNNSPLPNDRIQHLLYQVLRGLRYVHSRGVLHRDLKPSNLLINIDNWRLKIGDFGSSRVIKTGPQCTMSPGVGAHWYKAPEMIYGRFEYTTAIDIWSVGCILGEMLLGKTLFPGVSPRYQRKLVDMSTGTPEKAEKFFSSKFPNAPVNVLDLLGKMIVYDPEMRITAAEALDHEYFENCRDVNDKSVVCEALELDLADTLSKDEIRNLILEESMNWK